MKSLSQLRPKLRQSKYFQFINEHNGEKFFPIRSIFCGQSDIQRTSLRLECTYICLIISTSADSKLWVIFIGVFTLFHKIIRHRNTKRYINNNSLRTDRYLADIGTVGMYSFFVICFSANSKLQVTFIGVFILFHKIIRHRNTK